MTSLRDRIVHSAKEERIPPNGVLEAASSTKGDGVSQPGNAMVTLEGMRTASDRRTLPEPRHVIKEALVARGPAMWTEPVKEREARVEAL